MHLRTVTISLLCLTLIPSISYAQFNRTAVSVAGNDLNSCAVASPCRSFERALSQTNPGGELIALDSGGYGPFTIDRAVFVQAAPGVYAGITANSGIGLSVDAGVNDNVIVRNLSILGLGGSTGVSFTAGKTLRIDHTSIVGFGTIGILASAADSNLYVADSLLHRNVFNLVAEAVTGLIGVIVDRTHSTGGSNGFRADDGSRMTVKDSVAAGNGYGFIANCAAGTCQLDIENCVATRNTNTGIIAGSLGGTSTIRVSNSTVTYNGTGVGAVLGQNLLTRGNNTVEGNGVDGTFNGNFSAK